MKIAALDTYLQELDVELGPISSDDESAARQWADRVLGESGEPVPGRTTRSG